MDHRRPASKAAEIIYCHYWCQGISNVIHSSPRVVTVWCFKFGQWLGSGGGKVTDHKNSTVVEAFFPQWGYFLKFLGGWGKEYKFYTIYGGNLCGENGHPARPRRRTTPPSSRPSPSPPPPPPPLDLPSHSTPLPSRSPRDTVRVPLRGVAHFFQLPNYVHNVHILEFESTPISITPQSCNFLSKITSSVCTPN